MTFYGLHMHVSIMLTYYSLEVNVTGANLPRKLAVTYDYENLIGYKRIG